MIVTTTNTIEGHHILEYKEIVFGEVISGVNAIKDLGSGIRDIFGGRSRGYEEELNNCRIAAIEEMKQNAQNLGANAIVGVDIDYEMLGASNQMMMVTCSGTAVIID